MSFDINTNIASLQAQQYLRVTSDFQAKTINRVTSGLRIISSGDDAAGLAIANGFRSDQAVLTQGIRNANDGLSTLQTIDGGMNNISQLLDRARTLATQSASGTFNGDRSLLNSEFTSVLTEIDRQAQSIGLNSGGIFAKSLSVFIGGGRASGSTTTNQNGSVAVDLSKSTVDSLSLGLKGVQSVGVTATDIGTGSPATSVSLILAQPNNTSSEAQPGSTDFYFSGPGFGDANKVRVAVNLGGVADTSTLVTAINAAIQSAGNGTSQSAVAFKNAGIVAAVNTDATGKQQLAFSSSSDAFQVQAGDRVSNALLGNFSSGADGRDLAGTVTGATTTAGTTASNVIIRIQGSGLGAPVDIQIATGTTTANALTAIENALAASAPLAAAGISVNSPTAGAGALVFTNARGETFNVSAEGDTTNLLGLGTFKLDTAAGTSFEYTAITAGAAYAAAAVTNTLEFSIAGGDAVSLSIPILAADTIAQATDKLNTALAGNATTNAAGLIASNGGGFITITSSNGTAFRLNNPTIAANAALGFGGTLAAVAGGATLTSTAADSVNDVHFDAGGSSSTLTVGFSPIRNGNDIQTINFSANDATGAAKTLSVVLQNNAAAPRNARSLDEAIHTINAALQQSNDSTLKQITAVKEHIDATHEGIKFVSTLGNFAVGVGTTGSAAGIGDGTPTTQGQIYSSAVSNGGSTFAIDTQEGAANAVNALSVSVSLLGAAQAVVGKGQNQFNYAVNLAQSQLTNLTAAESRIRDADLASEAGNLTKAQILLQAGVAAVAQANSAPQAVLALLRG